MTESNDQTLVTLTTMRCMHCGRSSEVTMTRAQAAALGGYTDGVRPGNAKIQHIFPDWTPDQRELLISGTHPECWTEMFGEDEDAGEYEPTTEEYLAQFEPAETPAELTAGFLLVPVEGPTVILPAPSPDQSLAVMQKAVDGYVECVSIHDQLDMWCNDEGKFRSDFAQNDRAQRLWDARYGEGTDVIMGPVLLTGGADRKGETTALTAEQIADLRDTFGEA